MSYEQCLRDAYVDMESWGLVLATLVLSFALWKFGKVGIAITCIGVGFSLAIFWSYLYFEMTCVELYGSLD
ncbi:MAG: hypothetical protein ABJ327_12225 [Litoreibacter sp.]